MFSLINSPWVELLICIFTYLHSLWVAGCRSHSASGESALGHASRLTAFCCSSVGLFACLISPQRLVPRSSSPLWAEWTHWDEHRGNGSGNVLVQTLSLSLTLALTIGERACCIAGVLCDLQKRGSYFHHATTSPHWPCNGAMQAIDWLPHLKTQLGCCRRVWKSSLAQHTSVHGRVCLHTYHCH